MPFQSWQVVVELLEMGDFRTWRANKKEHDINGALWGCLNLLDLIKKVTSALLKRRRQISCSPYMECSIGMLLTYKTVGKNQKICSVISFYFWAPNDDRNL